jgi:hypothetical protein
VARSAIAFADSINGEVHEEADPISCLSLFSLVARADRVKSAIDEIKLKDNYRSMYPQQDILDWSLVIRMKSATNRLTLMGERPLFILIVEQLDGLEKFSGAPRYIRTGELRRLTEITRADREVIAPKVDHF